MSATALQVGLYTS